MSAVHIPPPPPPPPPPPCTHSEAHIPRSRWIRGQQQSTSPVTFSFSRLFHHHFHPPGRPSPHSRLGEWYDVQQTLARPLLLQASPHPKRLSRLGSHARTLPSPQATQSHTHPSPRREQPLPQRQENKPPPPSPPPKNRDKKSAKLRRATKSRTRGRAGKTLRRWMLIRQSIWAQRAFADGSLRKVEAT